VIRRAIRDVGLPPDVPPDVRPLTTFYESSSRAPVGPWFGGPTREVAPAQATRLTVALRESGTGTHLTLVHDRLDGLAAVTAQVADNVDAGWTGTRGAALDGATGESAARWGHCSKL
jgi:hypothetical protein